MGVFENWIVYTITQLGAISADVSVDVATDIATDTSSILGQYIGSMSVDMLVDIPPLLGRYVGRYPSAARPLCRSNRDRAKIGNISEVYRREMYRIGR